MKPFERIYLIVEKIPVGKVVTYQQIAKLAKVTPRVVSFAMHCNKNMEKIPCHRVIGKKGNLAGYVLGQKRKKEILTSERIYVDHKNNVDLNKYLFIPTNL